MKLKPAICFSFLLCFFSVSAQDTIREFDINDWIVPLKDTVIDIDGNVYHTQQIGTQVWMLENLGAKHFNDGRAVADAQAKKIWLNISKPAYSKIIEPYYDGTNTKDRITNHLVYNFQVIKDSSNICPCGWHVPAPAEWNTLENYMQKMNRAFFPLLVYYEEGTPQPPIPSQHIYGPFNIGFNSMLFGWRSGHNGSFNDFYDWGCWWSTDLSQVATAWYGIIDRGYGLEDIHLEEQGNNEHCGYTIKCIKNRQP